MEQTAVEFLAEKYNYITWLRNRDEISAGRADKMRADAYEQAKEMEKQQIINAWIDDRFHTTTKPLTLIDDNQNGLSIK